MTANGTSAGQATTCLGKGYTYYLRVNHIEVNYWAMLPLAKMELHLYVTAVSGP